MKVFNKQRFEFMEGKNLKKYLKYAFGEIILVVIGILIAVGINNWNQGRQLNNANLELKKNVIKQLDKDISAIEAYEKELDELQENYISYLHISEETKKTLTGDLLTALLFEVNTIDIDTHTITMIDNANLNDSKASEKLLDLNSMYKIYLDEVKSIERLIFTTMTDNVKEIERTQDWYTEFITDLKCAKDCVDFFINDKQHKARIASLRFLYVNGYGSLIKSLKEDLVTHQQELKQIED